MKNALFVSFILLCSSYSLQASVSEKTFFTNEAEIYGVSTCFRKPFDNHESWEAMIYKGAQKRTKTEDEAMKRMDTFKRMFPVSSYDKYKETLDCVTFKYNVGDEQVNGYLIRPKNQTELPIIYYNRGGNGNYGAMIFASLMNTLMPIAQKGFIVVGTQYRGTFQKGGGPKDEFGGADVDDVVTLIEKSKYIKNAQTDLIGMVGSSRGAMQSLLALKQLDHLVKVVALIAGNYDLQKDLEVRPEMEKVYEKRIPNYQTQKESQLRKRSALFWSSEIDTSIPILLHHGDQDKRVNVFNSQALARQFVATKRPHKLTIFKDDGHDLSKHKEEAFVELINWFDEYLK